MRPAPPVEVRDWAEALSTDAAAAMEELEVRDPAAAATIDGANPRRMARALERAAIGEPADGGGDIWSTPYRRPALLVGITRPREVIHRLIASRVRREIEDGLVAELEAALDRADLARGPGQVIGMREVAEMRSGGTDPSSLEEALNIRTRRLARMQDTWMRKMAPDVMVDLGDGPAADGVARVVAEWRRARGGVG
jgi:tRNA dimethylallyltransferase